MSTADQTAADEIQVCFPANHLIERMPVTKLGDNLYRLEGVPLLFEEAGYQDVVELARGESDWLQYVRTVERAGWKTFTYLDWRCRLQSEWAQSLLAELRKMGGYWQIAFGGYLHVCIPPELDFDPTEWFED